MYRGRRLAVALLFPVLLYGQDPDSKWQFQGYLKDLLTINIPEGADSVLVDNLVHNRMDVRWFPLEKLSTHLGIRTRIFNGDMVSLIPNYSELIDVNDDYFDLSITPVDRNQVVLHSVIDRAYLTYSEENWQVRAGRQRINWGINLAWNANDVFNAYSFFDFDYEERPGTDAIRFQRFTGFASGYEVAIKIADRRDELIAGTMYKWNVANYDFQAIGGVMRNHLFLGGGWAGSLDLSGFKGEFTILRSLDDRNRTDLLASVSLDHSFPNTLYLNGSVFYNSAHNQTSDLQFQSAANLDIRSLSPFQWSTLLQTTYQFYPLLTGSLATLYFPGEPGLFLSPVVTVSIVTNLDFDLIGQFFVDAEPANVTLLYARIKYSF